MKQFAVIKDIQFGCRDAGVPMVWFTAHLSDGGSCALICLRGEEMLDAVRKVGVYSISDLEGTAALVDYDDGIVRFLSFYRPGR